ncbi:MAG: VCBS repeat-containing protein [Roseibacillus sp.]
MKTPSLTLAAALCSVVLILAAKTRGPKSGHILHSYERVMLTDTYFSEGINAGDIDNDGAIDIVHGPFWFSGPDFRKKHPIYKAAPQNRDRYANNFFSWTYDFDDDGWLDVFTVGFPGTPAHVYRSPGQDGFEKPWVKHEVFDWVSNEAPHFIDLVGDDKPELVCTRDGYFGYATINWSAPFERWTFHKVSPQTAPSRFGHGLGVGDLNSDGRADILMKSGWFEQPAKVAGDPPWTHHKVPFAPRGGAEMYAYDVDGDGDRDVITSLAAHDFGLSWFEQTPKGFVEHLIMGDRPALNKYGVVFSEPHSVQLADMDGDGLKDIVTGKTYWSHHRKSPGWDDGAVVYWFKLVRHKDSVDWIPMKADGESGIGRQIIIKDLNGDKLPDILVGGMKGAHALIHRAKPVDKATWQAAQPKPIEKVESPIATGKPAPIDEATGAVPDALEGEKLVASAKVTGGSLGAQNMKNFSGARWSGNSQLFWKGGKVGDRLTIEIPAGEAGAYVLETVFTRAPDYGIVQLAFDGKDLGSPIDLYDFSKVSSTGVLTFPTGRLASGAHHLSVRITGANPNAKQSRFIGLDYVRLSPAK